MQHLQQIDYILFEDFHNFQVIDELFTTLGEPECLCLIRCLLGDHATGRFGKDFGGRNLLLKEINQDLVPLLHLWDGDKLFIINCPHLNDSAIDMMGS